SSVTTGGENIEFGSRRAMRWKPSGALAFFRQRSERLLRYAGPYQRWHPRALEALRFEASDGSLAVSVSAMCVDHWLQFRQTRFWQREAGGLMFAPTIGSADGHVEITHVNGPYTTDRAT